MHPGITSWKNLLNYAYNAFSTPLLLRTLFAPWQMDRAEGANFSFIEKVAFAVVSRLIGFVARVILIILGLWFTFLVLLSFPIFLLVPFKISEESLIRSDSFGASLSYGNTYVLNKHSRDLCSPAAKKIYGKDKALRMIERGLSKDTNHNVLLVGETGVGKSSLCEYLGRLGRSGLSFPGIRHHRVVELEIEGITLEDLDAALHQAEKAGNVILVIKNIHGYESAYQRILPYLTRPHLGIIATTDYANYDQVLKNHPEFLSKFEKVDLLPSGPEDTLAILKNTAEITHTRIQSDALAEIVRLSERFIGNQPEPMKSIAVLEE
ncbi:MAG TPA: hypothetical protein VG694_02125, partial [Candidatus Paceibacterota bacterium]|nr:hypothetical protein [Candidatus Paceibacterota bacterium]